MAKGRPTHATLSLLPEYNQLADAIMLMWRSAGGNEVCVRIDRVDIDAFAGQTLVPHHQTSIVESSLTTLQPVVAARIEQRRAPIDAETDDGGGPLLRLSHDDLRRGLRASGFNSGSPAAPHAAMSSGIVISQT